MYYGRVQCGVWEWLLVNLGFGNLVSIMYESRTVFIAIFVQTSLSIELMIQNVISFIILI